MIIGIGVDIVSVAVIATALSECGDEYLETICTAAEVAYCKLGAFPAQRIAARFAAKEAAMKALGTGWIDELMLTDFEILIKESGEPYLTYHGAAIGIVKNRGVTSSFVSLSHDIDYAVALVVLER